MHEPHSIETPDIRLVNLTAPQDKVDRVRLEVSHIVEIYRVLYPHQHLNFLFYEGHDPIWGAPTATEREISFAPEHLSAEYLGCLELPGAHVGAPVVSILISVPRAPTAGEMKQQEPDWNPAKPLKMLFGTTPLLYEEIRFKVEMRRKRRAREPHTSLPSGGGSSVLQHPKAPDSTMRPAILIGMHWLELGGAEKLAFDSIHWALEAGLRVFVVAGVPALQRLASKLPDHPDVVFIRLDRYLPRHLWPRYIERLVSAENIRVVHIHHCQPMYDALPQIRIKTPWVKVIDSTHIIEYSGGGFPRVSGVWSNFIDTHHVISRELVDYYRERFQVLEGKVALGRMLERTDRRAAQPARMQAGQTTLHVSFIGRLYYQKRPIVLVEMLRALAAWARKNDVDLSGTIVGEGPFRNAVTRLLQRYGIGHMFTVEPADCDIPELLGRSDILLLPSNNEGLALVCYEAVEHGCIPISTDVGSQGEIVPADLLLPLSPRAGVRKVVKIVDRLWRDEDFLARQKDALLTAWSTLAAEPTAKEVLMPHYRAAAGTTESQ